MSGTGAAFLLQRVEDVPEDDRWLTAAERDVLHGLRVPMRRMDWRLGRWTAKRALRRVTATGLGGLGFGPSTLRVSDLEIRSDVDGAPQAFGRGAPLPVVVSLSHRDGWAMCAVAGRGGALGCDLEVVEARSEGFLSDYFTDREIQTATARPERRELLVVLMWSAKESLLKATGQGLRVDTRSVEVDLMSPQDLGKAWQSLVVQEQASGRRLAGWWQRRGPHMLTIVAEPPSAPPIDLACLPDQGPVKVGPPF
jgi:4'-phosphopantetheinyl transferase